MNKILTDKQYKQIKENCGATICADCVMYTKEPGFCAAVKLSRNNDMYPYLWDVTDEKDTQEKINHDTGLSFLSYWKCLYIDCPDCPAKFGNELPKAHYNVMNCSQAMILDLLARQRKLLEKEK